MRLPKVLRINGIIYAVNSTPLDDCGNFNAKLKRILIADDLPEDIEELTLWHEAIHAYNHELSEEDVERIAQMIIQIRRDNQLYE